ncbi:MAG: STAS domain-containing protein [Acidimicrobiales bacterium]
MHLGATSFQAEVLSEPASVVVVLRGEIDLANASAVQDVLVDAFETGRVLAVDMAGVTFVDSSGMAAFIAVSKRTDPDQLVLRNVTRRVARTLEAAGLTDYFNVVSG